MVVMRYYSIIFIVDFLIRTFKSLQSYTNSYTTIFFNTYFPYD